MNHEETMRQVHIIEHERAEADLEGLHLQALRLLLQELALRCRWSARRVIANVIQQKDWTL